LRANDVTYCPRNIEPSEEEDLFGVARDVCLVDGHKGYVGRPVCVENIQTDELASEVGAGQSIADDCADEGEEDRDCYYDCSVAACGRCEVRQSDSRKCAHSSRWHCEQCGFLIVKSKAFDNESVESCEASIGDLKCDDGEPDEPSSDVHKCFPDLLYLEGLRFHPSIVDCFSLNEHILLTIREPFCLKRIVW